MTTVIRPAWSPDDDRQRKLLADAVRLAQKARQADSAKWAAMLRARVAGVPDEVLCDQTEESRATLNRRYGPRRDMHVTWTGDNLAEVQTLQPQARISAGDSVEVPSSGEWFAVEIGGIVRGGDQSPT